MEKGVQFERTEALADLDRFIASWNREENPVKDIFLEIKSIILNFPEVMLDFRSRPGVSYSLRASKVRETPNRLFVLVDVVDDDPENRWLSICFYADAVSDPEGKGNRIPGGILGKDGHCFDLFEEDAPLVPYLGARIREAHRHVTKVLSMQGRDNLPK